VRRVWRFLPTVAWAGLIFFLSSREHLPDVLPLPGSDKLAHAFVYGVLAAWILFGASGPTGSRAYAAAGVASLYGVTDELHQYFVPGRSTDVLDWLADTVGATLCVALWQVYRGRRRGPGGV
jgi:VanZ family protein